MRRPTQGCSTLPAHPRALAALLAAFWIAVPPGRADAADTGGTRSVFASGAGSRALSMGGAFVGLADDASAMIWNPGGLGGLQRVEVQAAHTTYGGLGSHVEYASAVLPDWRWGTAGVSILHFGIDGIEARDDRNLLLGEDLSDSETEIGLGFGRPLSDALSVGGTIKLQRQSVAGFSGSGLGLDIGVVARAPGAWRSRIGWADRMTLGVSVRNAIQPTLRLDQERVADPTVLRLGLAYRHPSVIGRPALLVLDVERTDGIGARLHTGMEVRPHPLLGIRAGLNRGNFTAGTAVALREFEVGYVFENGHLGDVHHFGISRALGATVSERREAALRDREKADQTRLDDAFERRQAEQLDELLARVAAARARGDDEGALELLSTIGILYPREPRVSSLEALALRDRGLELEAASDYAGAAVAFARALVLAPGDTIAAAGQIRSREASHRRAARSEKIQRLFADASDAFAADSLAKARAGFQAVLRIDRADGDAAAMLRRTEEAIGRRTRILLRQAWQSIESSLFEEAEALLTETRTLDPGTEGLAGAVAELARARGVAVAPRPTRSVPTKEQEREVEELYRRAQAAMSQRRMDDALRYWELVWSLRPGYKRVGDYLKREYLMRGMELFASGRLEEAVALWQKALQVDPKDRRAAGYIARARTQLARTREIMGEGR